MKLLILAGTSEGRKLAEYCEKQQIETVVSVATLYGESMIADGTYVTIHCGRMDQKELEDFLEIQQITQVVDATHPYAVLVTENAKEACVGKNIPYMRLLRESRRTNKHCVMVESIEQAVEYLKDTVGNVLITTGSKELKKYTALADLGRLFPRILPNATDLSSCETLGIPKQNFIGMQGPFSKELNKAMLHQINGKYLVTKEAGNAGGFTEKIEACIESGGIPIVIKRPTQEEGYSLEEIQKKFQKRKKIRIAGIGPGDDLFMTAQVKAAMESADICIGAKRMVEAAEKVGKTVFISYKNEEIKEFIQTNDQYVDLLILMSGDVGFFSGAKKLMDELKFFEPELLPGISSMVYICSRVGLTWENVKMCSLHGRPCNLLDHIRDNQKVFALLGSGKEVQEISKKLMVYGMDGVKIHLGIQLSYPEERVLTGYPQDFLYEEVENLCVVLFENPLPMGNTHSLGIPEEHFIRAKIPMTKEEVRVVSISKMKLKKDAVIYDIGAGTGSVSIEMALLCLEGTIYAIEKKEEAIALIQANMKKFQVGNIDVIQGIAPQVLVDLPKPTHAFIGGSAGNLEEILAILFEKNPAIRVVINAIALETIAQVITLSTERKYQVDITQVNVARGRGVGHYHLMTGENPVMIFTLWKG